MVDRQTFMETLHGVEEIAKTAAKPLTKEQIMEYFQGMELSEEQEQLVYDYIQKQPVKEETEDELDVKVEELRSSTEEQKKAEEEFLNSAYVKMYMEDIAGIEPLAQGELESLYDALLRGDVEASALVVNQYLHQVIELAKRYVLLDVRMEDVIQEGNMALLMAVNELLGVEEARDVDACLKEQIQLGMERFIDETLENENWQNAVLARAGLLNEAKQALARELLRVPSLEELSEYTKLSVEEISDIMALVKEKKAR